MCYFAKGNDSQIELGRYQAPVINQCEMAIENDRISDTWTLLELSLCVNIYILNDK